MKQEIRTAECVMCGHPDKFCDVVSDMVLDACYSQDPDAKVACEVFATQGLIVIGGEITTTATPNYNEILSAAATFCGVDISGCRLIVAVRRQSKDISDAVNHSLEQRAGETDFFSAQGAGDQGIMIGYACDETLSYMPIEYEYARKITERLELLQKSGGITGIGLDGKSQVSAEFVDGRFVRFTKIVISVQHSAIKSHKELEREIMQEVIDYVFGDFSLKLTEILINPSGQFVIGGIEADTGLTGRKIVADAYGPRVAVGGGAFSGKDPSKVDRSGAYMARYIAKNIVAAGLAERCEVQLAYAIGRAEPMAVNINTFGTGTTSEAQLNSKVECLFEVRPKGIIRQLDLLRPIYARTASGGHFGKEDADYSWEHMDLVADLKKLDS